jgi:hypothetical protein
MQLSGLILGLLLAVRVTPHPSDHDHSSFIQTRDHTTTAEIVTRGQRTEKTSVQRRGLGPTSTQSGTQSCHCRPQFGFWNSYSVLITIPYQGPSPCDNTYHILESWVAISNWQCVEKDGNTQLYFNSAAYRSSWINNGLLAAFPNVGGGFNCKDN